MIENILWCVLGAYVFGFSVTLVSLMREDPDEERLPLGIDITPSQEIALKLALAIGWPFILLLED